MRPSRCAAAGRHGMWRACRGERSPSCSSSTPRRAGRRRVPLSGARRLRTAAGRRGRKLIPNSVPITDETAFVGEAAADDRWQGYPAQREELLAHITDNAIEGIVRVSVTTTSRWSPTSTPREGRVEPVGGAGRPGRELPQPRSRSLRRRPAVSGDVRDLELHPVHLRPWDGVGPGGVRRGRWDGRRGDVAAGLNPCPPHRVGARPATVRPRTGGAR